MAERLRVEHQQLQQFVTTSTWDHTEIRRRLGARMCCGALGKRGNCQIGLSVHAATDWASAAVDWRLFLPESRDDRKAADKRTAAETARKRARCAIPDDQRHREKWRLALDMIDETLAWGLPRRPVVADAAHSDGTAFRQGLTDRGLTYTLAVSASTSVYPRRHRPGPADMVRRRAPTDEDDLPRQARHRQGPRDGGRTLGREVRGLAPRLPQEHRQPDHASPLPRDAGTPGQPQHPRAADGSLPECWLPESWLLAEWPAGGPEPIDYWLSTLPADIRLRDLVNIAKIRWRIEHDYRELKDGLGLDHFEGRSWLGWHRHVIRASVAQAVCTQLRRTPPKAHARD